MNEAEFRREFKRITRKEPHSKGMEPLRWQWRLFRDHFASGSLPEVIDLPTGLGKTMVMAIWLIARNENKCLPRRLIYVVDRRTVVDQATDLANMLRDAMRLQDPKHPLAISTLRGQLADNRDWSRDLSRPAIIIGTVDLIGSGLLFSGYRSSFKRRPLEAGLLGQDTLLVLDEAHLSKPFEKLLNSITQFQRRQGSPMRVIRMSATRGESPRVDAFRLDTDSNEPRDEDAAVTRAGENLFRLETDPNSPDYDLKPDRDPDTREERNHTFKRFTAKKRLTITYATKVTEAIAADADQLAGAHPGARIVIFVTTPAMVDAVRKALIKKDRSRENRIAQLTGTMRGLERDELVKAPDNEDQDERRVMQRFLNPDNDPTQGVCFLISTSAGEVGFDLNADHMVCDAAPLDSMIQRLGRVNRRGWGDAVVHLVLQNREKGEAGKTDRFEEACIKASKLFHDDMDVSPRAIAELKSRVPSDQLESVSAPEPAMVELTDILLDAWSMTSITDRMPGRPEVAPWLRGIADDLPQTTIAWRVELDLPGFDQLTSEDIDEWFDAHGIRTHEALSVPTSAAAKWFTDRWDSLTDAERFVVGARSIVIDRAGVKLVTVKELIGQLARKSSDSIRNADLVLPASFGGIERGVGLLDSSAPQKPVDETDADEEARKASSEARRTAPDVADELHLSSGGNSTRSPCFSQSNHSAVRQVHRDAIPWN